MEAHEAPSLTLPAGHRWGAASLVVVGMAVLQIRNVRVGVHERGVLMAVGVASGHRWDVGMDVVAVVAAVLVLMHDRLVGVFVFVAGP